MESDGVQLVCTTVLSGSVAGRTITINYETADGVAVGEPNCFMVLHNASTYSCIMLLHGYLITSY